MRRGRLFYQLLSTYMVILLLTITILAAMFYQLLQNYFYNQTETMLLDRAREINIILNDYSKHIIDSETLTYELQTIDRSTNARIWVVDSRGVIFTETGPIGERFGGIRLTEDEIKNVLKGQTVVKKGYFGGRFPTPMLTVGIPITTEEKITGAIFMHAPIYEINRTMMGAFHLAIISAIISVFIAGLPIYYASSRMSVPLVEMSKAVSRISSGDFDVELNENRDDEIGELAHAFNLMARDLRNLEEMRRSFVANVSHELRSPLTSIRGYITGILDGTIEEKDREKYLNIVLQESKRLTTLINDLLDLTQIQSGQIPLNLSEFDINEVVRITVIKLEYRLNEKNVDFVPEFENDSLKVCADRNRIEQVVYNLMDNAIKYSKEGGTVWIKTFKRDGKAYVSVKDNGVGIKEEDLPYIFERFYKGDKARTDTSSGLGLSIVKSIIDQHGETIEVRSKVGEGTEFVFTLKAA
ncbi:sensor histidine kinase [Calorimonas adulescens]|jgi:His Kinase A (phosphoacceptor) domain./Histidine kinase-, DNA gyrase B-, and HSP90-like ATPase./HAMP domain.|uniref:histidine kinase n=1 Tax=Calorimonas adulescens TaxID=2606906 RepID=A0A5D8QA40_9THEO|nr:ATP-binding protein [Calorimonas adulescens]TZE81381.1 cell wall metabolism sensor histidine kinase WalK [Calorimonas adulescens]